MTEEESPKAWKVCEMCGRECGTPMSYYAHIAVKHREMFPMPKKKCEECGKEFFTVSRFAKGIAFEKKKYCSKKCRYKRYRPYQKKI